MSAFTESIAQVAGDPAQGGKQPVQEFLELCFDSAERDQFRSGELVAVWAAAFPQLFGDTDVALTANQRQYHFYEWLAAVRLYERFGLLSLIEKYQFRRRTEAHRLFCSLVPASVCERLAWRKGRARTQVSDLFVYTAGRDEWFFCEVKGPHDRLRPEQLSLFIELESLTRKPIRLIHCIEKEF